MNAMHGRSRLGYPVVAGVAVALAGCSMSVLDPEQGTGVRFFSPPPPPPATVSVVPEPAAERSGGVDHRTPLIGLYGELLNDSGPTGRPFDGSSNVSQITFASEGACSDPDVDPKGAWIAFASTQHRTTSDIYVKPITGRTLTQVTTDPADDVMPSWHPSGKSMAFASNRGGNWDIFVVSVDGGQPTRVTDEPEPELHPSWSPDGKRLIYCKLGSMSGRWEIWVVEVDNPGVRRFLDYGLFPQWCPDPARPKILLQRARQRGSRYFSVWTVDYVNGDAVHATEIASAGNAAVINPSWSPDGERIVFVTVVEPEENGESALEQADVWIINLDGSARTNLTNGKFANYQPAWGADGRVYFVSDRTGVENIWSVTTARALDNLGGTPTNVTAVPPENDH